MLIIIFFYNDKIRMDLDVEYPKTIVIVVTAHGKIQVDTNFQGIKEPEIFAIPSGMTLNRINAVVPGVCNYLSDPFARKVMEIARTNITAYDLHSQENIPPGFVNHLRKTLVRETNKDWQLDKRVEDVDKEDVDLHLKDYHTHSNKSYRSSKHESYKFALNKIYSTPSLSPNYNNTITFFLPDDGELDYFTALIPPYQVDLKSIVHILSDLGVKNLILIDLSCSVFYDKTLDERDIRHLRLDSYKEGYGGNKRSKHKRTNKYSKHKRTNKYSKHKQSNKRSKKHKRSKHKRSKHKRSKY
jgi:hypothetical protein